MVLVLVVATLGGCASATLPAMPGFESETITVDGRDVTLAVADTPAARRRGLMGVTDLGRLDGMLFVFEADTDGGFWMKDTLIPLDITFFDVAGAAVDHLTMEPCITDSCPTYFSSAPYRYAIEVPAGSLEFVSETSTLTLPPG
jgi:uncharacterized membrane protein (UPF0127 family)